jgi:MEDS: MEthanogen/methylotroph, DcmR Sensory domain
MTQRVVYQQGDHICTLFSTPEEQMRAATDYIRDGLARDERCLYVCCERDLGVFRARLADAGIDVREEEARTALVILTKEQAHLKGGSFDAAQMLEMLNTAVAEAIDAGFEGLRAAGDMSWVLDSAPGTEQLAKYEAMLNHFYRSHRALGMCMYNRRTLPANVLDDCLATHEHIVVDGSQRLSNPYYEGPDLGAMRTANPAGVQERIDRATAGSPA